MKKIIAMTAGLLTLVSCSAEKGGVTISMPSADAPKTIVVNHHLVSDMLNAKSEAELKNIADTMEVKNGKVTLPVDERGAARYIVQLNDASALEFYTQPGETITVDVEKLSPLAYSIAGSPLMDDITKLQKTLTPLEQEYASLAEKQQVSMEDIQAFMLKYERAVTDFIKANPKSVAVPYAMFQLQGESLVNAYQNLTPEAKKSILYPIVEKQVEGDKEQVEKEREMERKINELSDGHHAAPAFKLKDINGKEVSLSDFKGKWVILDFWGTWCGWCVKGIPRLKEAYKEYAGKVEVIGIDCNEPEQAWRDGVAKYELPWVNVYNPSSTSVLKDYMIQGFPTKVIVDPSGNIADITIGEDPSFYTKLSTLVNGK